MYARTTLFEIDTLRISVDDAVRQFTETVLPHLREQPGGRGIFVLTSPEGKGMLLSLWDSEEAAEQSIASGFYDAHVSDFLMFLRQPPGRDHYTVMFHEFRPEPGDLGTGSHP